MLDLSERRAATQFRPASQFDEAILCHHNYVAEEVHFGEEVLVTRKGAIRAGKGELGIIPGSMGTRSRTSCAGSATPSRSRARRTAPAGG